MSDRTGMLRGAAAALVVYGVVLAFLIAPGSGLDPNQDEAVLYAFTIIASLAAALAGTAAGSWQARAGGVRAPIRGLGAAAATVILAGVALTAANGGQSAPGDLLIYLAHPLGALAGAVLYGRRWLATVR
jgi:formate hydrogenlyase subunit 4